MSNLPGGSTPSGGPASGRTQNVSGTSAASAGRPMLTPTQIMAIRKDRERRRAEQEAALKQQQEEVKTRGNDVVGVGGRRTGDASQAVEEQAPVSNPPITTSRRRTETVPVTNGAQTRIRPSTVKQDQPRPVSEQQQAEDPTFTVSGQVHKNRSEAFDKLNMPAVAGVRPPQPQNTKPSQPAGTSAQQTTRPTFPHAFERWETLSSHWEGLTGYWIRRLEANTDELSGKPIDQQMARQITDLSAAGANLFHAVVELQRLRASSERKFQRWFFETRNEQEQSRERVAELERQLLHERENPSNTTTEAIDTMRAEKQKAEELVREMRRELQISKEEARRAWEELGRREQEERDRTIALRSGEPTSIGGVQVVPMAGPGLIPRQYASSSQRPQTRDGPISGGPGSSRLGGQTSQEIYSRSQTTLESPDQEQAQFTYQPGGTSPTETDPFTETHRGKQPQIPSNHGSDTQMYSQPSRTQPTTSAAAMATRQASSSPQSSRHQAYEQAEISTATYQPITTIAPSTVAPPRTGTAGTDRSDARSYIPSISGAGSEEEYHINPDGSYTRDAHGRRIPYNQPIGGAEEASDDDDYTAEVERERMYAQEYNRRRQQASQGQSTQSSTQASSQGQYVSPLEAQMVFQPQESPVSPESPITSQSRQSAGQYQGSGSSHIQQSASGPGATWDTITTEARHRHPTRLSDILEEQSGRTSPSRSSYLSGDYPPPATGNGHQRR